MANEKEYKGLNNTYHTNDKTYIDFSNRKKTRWLKRFFPNFVKDKLKPLVTVIATFDGENYYHKVEGNMNQTSYALTDSEKAFNAITDNNPIYGSGKYSSTRLYHIDSNGGGPYYSHCITTNAYDKSNGQRAYDDIRLCKTSAYSEITLTSGRYPDEKMSPNNVFARFYNVPSEDGTSYVLYYALVGED